MGKIITVASHKGGVGKTTTVLNLGFSLSRFGQKVLLVDADPQGAISVATNLKKLTTRGLIHILRNETPPEQVIIPTKDKTMAVLGIGVANPSDIFFFRRVAREGRVQRVITSIARGYDYILIDAPAGIDNIVSTLLCLSNSLLIPITCQAIAVKTLPIMLKLSQKFREKLNPDLKIEGILITMMSNRQSELNALEDIQKTFPPAVLFDTIIPYDEAFETASVHALPVALVSDGEEAARAYIDLAIELKSRELLDKTKGKRDGQVEGLF